MTPKDPTPMKLAVLCFLHPHKVPGGQQRVAYDLFTRAARKHGAGNAMFIAGDFDTAPMKTAQSSTITEVAPNEFVYVCRGFDFRFYTNPDTSGQLELIRLLESFQPDVVHMHHFLGFGLDFVFLMRARLPGARLCFTVHEFLAVCHNNGHLRRRYDGGICDEVHALRCQQCFPEERLDYFHHRRSFFADAFECFDAVSAVSQYAAAVLERNLPLRQRIRVIQNGPVMSDDLARARAHPNGNTGRCVVGFIGQVHPAKGVDMFLDGMLDLVREKVIDPERVEVQVFGNIVDPEHGEKLKEFVEIAGYSGLTTGIRGVYAPGNLAPVFSELDVVVIPSLWPESYCLSVDEAILAGKRVVCSRFPAILERATETSGLFLYEMGSRKDLKRALVRALRAFGSEEWQDPFTVPVLMLDEIHETYESVLYRPAQVDGAAR